MPIAIEDLEEFKARADAYTGIEIFYQRSEKPDKVSFRIVAGKTCWTGSFSQDRDSIDKHVAELDKWLEERGAVKVSGWLELSELFS